LVLGAWGRPSKSSIAAAWASLSACALALLNLPASSGEPIFFGMIVTDPFSLAFRWLALGTCAIVCLLVCGLDDGSEDRRGEYLGLVLLIGSGLMLMAEANHLLMVYLAIELVSLSSYLLVGFSDDARGSEAALKYLLFGALASGIMLFGMSLLFGLTGQLGFFGLLQATSGMASQPPCLLLFALVLTLVGLAFKISLVPFHMWTPDVYEGAPVPVTALLSVGPKAAALALLVRLMSALHPLWPSVEGLFLVLTVVTMTFGNLVALVQTNVKRLLAYSTIGQVGYILIGFVVQSTAGLQALVLYLAAYLFMNLGAFACVAWVVNATRSESIDAFRGLSRKAPALAFLLTVFLLSLAGIPPLLGFLGKFLLFGAALQASHVGLAVAGAANSAVALYYYLKLIRQMYLAPAGEAAGSMPGTFALRLAAWLCAAATLVLGVFPGSLLALLKEAMHINLL
jgi:proton-translocating NADH-quinone oxidoreductase chain N